MAIIFEGAPPQYEGCVLSEGPWWYPVPSDNAMIDSGEGREVVVWDHSLNSVEVLHLRLGRPGPHLTVTVDASPDLQQRALAYQQVRDWMWACIDAGRSASTLQTGKRVMVDSKCKKIPKDTGPYTITYIGNGQYGPYAHLVDDKNNRYQYISTKWLMIADAEKYVVAPCPYGGDDETVRKLVKAAALITDGDPSHWLIVADRLDDLSHPAAPFVRAVANRWAQSRR